MLLKTLLLSALISLPLLGQVSDKKLTSLYNGLDPKSLSEHLAFYKLYKDSTYGPQALEHIQKLVGTSQIKELSLSSVPVESMIAMLEGSGQKESLFLEEDDLSLIENLTSYFPYKELKGHLITSEEELLTLSPEEVDISRALLLAQHSDPFWIRHYEASLDFMALQIMAKLPKYPADTDKIEAINDFLFFENKYRFPPLSTYSEEIEVYSFLSSVIDNKRGFVSESLFSTSL